MFDDPVCFIVGPRIAASGNERHIAYIPSANFAIDSAVEVLILKLELISKTAALSAFALLMSLATSFNLSTAQDEVEPFFPGLLPISVDNAEEVTEVLTLEYGNPSYVADIAWRSDGRMLAIAGALGVSLYVSDSLDEPEALSDIGAFSVDFSPTGQLLAFVDGGNVHLWDLEAESELAVFKYSGAIHVEFSPNGEILAAGSGDGTIQLWDLQSYSVAATLESRVDNGVSDMQFSPNGDLVVAVSVSIEGVYVWGVSEALLMDNAQATRPREVLESPFLQSLAFNPSGSLLATGAWDPLGDRPTITIWDINSREQTLHLRGTAESTRALVFHPTGNLLASADEKTAILWDVATGEELAVLEGHTDRISSVIFNPDGTLLVSAGYDGTVRFWGVPSSS